MSIRFVFIYKRYTICNSQNDEPVIEDVKVEDDHDDDADDSDDEDDDDKEDGAQGTTLYTCVLICECIYCLIYLRIESIYQFI